MSNQGLLAAVHAAALPPADASVTSQPKENVMAELKTTASAVTTAAELMTAFPDLCVAIKADGATAERARILGIAALGSASNAALILEMQNDPKVTPADAALRILNAQNEARSQQLQAITDVNGTTSAIKPAHAAAAVPSAPVANTADGWKAEYAASADLQQEFSSAETYVAFKEGEASGRVRRLSVKSA